MKVDHVPALADVSDAEWARLGQRKIFFGHQSVGQNIIEGIAAVLAANPSIHLTVVESKQLDTSTMAGFYHAKVGQNTFPASKTEEFTALADRGFGADGGVAMVKYCYVDVNGTTDPVAMFDAYRRGMTALAAKHPGLTIVHFTLPLTTTDGTLRTWKLRLLGRPTAQDVNAIRSRYNRLMRETYSGRAPVFDIARLESTRADGSRSFFTRGADTVPTLVPEYTSDGGHLTLSAATMVAEQLLIFLAKLP